MTYIEWRDELNSYLGSLPKDEKEKIFFYFSEMYADKRDAGISEREIVAEFGAPYDVAQRVLNEKVDDSDELFDEQDEPKEEKPKKQKKVKAESEPERAKKADGGDDAGRIILIIIMIIPIFVISVVAASVTFALCVTPISLIIGGFCEIGAGIGAAVAEASTLHVLSIGEGVIAIGVGLMLTPLFGFIIKIIWKAVSALYKAVFRQRS